MKLSLPVFKYTFTPSWVMIFLTIIAVSFFTRLGYWQIQRAQEKQKAIADYSTMAQSSKIVLKDIKQKVAQYQPIQARGTFLSQIFFLDNQHQNHEFGFDVIIPLEQEDGSVVLVDLGWVRAQTRDRSSLPNIDIPKGVIDINGNAYFPSKKGFVLGEPLEKISENLAIVENQDVKIFSKFLHKSVYPFIIRESENSNAQFVRNWQVVSMPPVRHYGYAFQWFAIAVVTFIIFISLNIKKQK